MKTIYANSFEVSHSDEAFLLIFKFESPDGYVESVYVALSPAGTVVLKENLKKEITDYIKAHGNIVMGTWKAQNHKNCNNNHEQYLS